VIVAVRAASPETPHIQKRRASAGAVRLMQLAGFGMIDPERQPMTKIVAGQPRFRNRRLPSYPIGILVKVRMVSGKEIDAQITRIETTALVTYLNVEFDDEVANVTAKQILGFYDFCFFKGRRGKRYDGSETRLDAKLGKTEQHFCDRLFKSFPLFRENG
jgi:hypothetical protein